MRTTAKIVADTISKDDARITTFEVTAPRFLLAEVNTHRVIAKSAASSRAIPVEKRVSMVEDAPFVPLAFGKNKPGMQAEEDLDSEHARVAEEIWREAAKNAARHASALAKLGVHKQHANRLLEPFVYYTGVMTATEWSNFFYLRTHPDAQPEFRELALLMKSAYDSSSPREALYHLPYTDDITEELPVETLFRVSSARCARVSYRTFDGKRSTLDADFRLCDDLISGGHLSPFDHPAISDVCFSDIDGRRHWLNPLEHKHNVGWIPYRTRIETRLGMECARSSFSPLE